MKIKKILTFVFAAALMTSCGNEDGPGGDGGNGGGTEHTEYFGVNMSGAEFGNVYPGVDGTHYGYPTKKDLEYFKEKGKTLLIGSRGHLPAEEIGRGLELHSS